MTHGTRLSSRDFSLARRAGVDDGIGLPLSLGSKLLV
jgi:hypothetical protein